MKTQYIWRAYNFEVYRPTFKCRWQMFWAMTWAAWGVLIGPSFGWTKDGPPWHEAEHH